MRFDNRTAYSTLGISGRRMVVTSHCIRRHLRVKLILFGPLG